MYVCEPLAPEEGEDGLEPLAQDEPGLSPSHRLPSNMNIADEAHYLRLTLQDSLLIDAVPPGSAYLSCRASLENTRTATAEAATTFFDVIIPPMDEVGDCKPLIASLRYRRRPSEPDHPPGKYDILATVNGGFSSHTVFSVMWDQPLSRFADTALRSPQSQCGFLRSSSSAPAPLHGRKLDVPPLHNNDIFVPDPLHAAHQTNVQSHHIPATSPDTATAGGTRQGIDSSTRTVPRSSGSTLTLQHDAGSRASSDAPDCPSSPSPTPFVDTMIHMSTFSSSDLPQLDPTALTGTTAPLATSPDSSPQQKNVPHSGATPEGEDGAKAACAGTWTYLTHL
ncbi:hypothetical protein EDB85DRAFT_2160092 [Lactarius pseudohatsudake]|nr:hypothetical protein EDB85DRAFT_2160092 [Lactarius pseudohatsudake]